MHDARCTRIGIERKICSMRRGFCTLVLFINYVSRIRERTVRCGVNTCGTVVTRSMAIESETRCDEDRAPLIAAMDERRSAKERRQRSHPMVVE